MYPQRPPVLTRLSIDDVLPLAEAAEKYEIYFAILACETYFKYVPRYHDLGTCFIAIN